MIVLFDGGTVLSLVLTKAEMETASSTRQLELFFTPAKNIWIPELTTTNWICEYYQGYCNKSDNNYLNDLVVILDRVDKFKQHDHLL